jgi:hypothetical protein
MTFYDRLTQRLLRRPVESTLAAVVGVMNHLGRAALSQRHVESGQDELSAQMRLHGPADDAAAPGIEHDGEVQEAGPGRDVGDVRDPQPIGPGGGELPIDEIRCRLRRLVPDRRSKLPPADALQLRGPHQAGDALATDVNPLSGQLGMDPRRAVRPSRLAVDPCNQGAQFHIGPGAWRQRSLAPRVIAAGGDAQRAA